MERVVVRRCNNTSFSGHTQCLLHCSHQVVRGTSELLRGTVYQAARPRSRAAYRERCPTVTHSWVAPSLNYTDTTEPLPHALNCRRQVVCDRVQLYTAKEQSFTWVVQGKPARNSTQQTTRVDIFFHRRIISNSSTTAVTIHSTQTNYANKQTFTARCCAECSYAIVSRPSVCQCTWHWCTLIIVLNFLINAITWQEIS